MGVTIPISAFDDVWAEVVVSAAYEDEPMPLPWRNLALHLCHRQILVWLT